MYDVSDYPGTSLDDDIKDDWRYFVDEMGVTESPMYLRHKVKPLLVLRNLGMPDRPARPRRRCSSFAGSRPTPRIDTGSR